MTDLHGVVEYLVFVFSDAENVLEQIEQLFLAESRLRHAAGRLPLRPTSWILVAAHDLVELGHPRADDGLLGQAVDLRQSADAPLDVVAEDLAEVGGGQAAPLHHRRDALTAQEHVEVAVNRTDERLVGRDR